MDKFDRIYKLHNILRGRRTPIAMDDLKEQLGQCSRPTVFRTLALLRDLLDAPVVYLKEPDGYMYRAEPGKSAYELPGFWFTAEELQA